VPGASLAPAGEGQPFDALKVEHGGAGQLSLRILQIPSPKVRHRRYALLGRVRVEGVKGEGYLEMWSHFQERGRFFSRTLAPDGPLQSLSGTQAWRRFALPFDASGSVGPPLLIELSLVLSGPGRVWLGPIRLVDLEDGPVEPMGAEGMRAGSRRRPPSVPPWRLAELWWHPDYGGWVNALGAGLLGLLGLVMYVFGLRSRRLGLVRQLVGLSGLLGSMGIILGAVAMMRDQPGEVHEPLLLLGGLGIGLALLGAWLARRAVRRPRGS
jgi:hypothetical protein